MKMDVAGEREADDRSTRESEERSLKSADSSHRSWWRSLRSGLVIRGALSSRSSRFGVLLISAILLVALFGPLLSPYSPTETVGIPFGPANRHQVFGTDLLGRDVLSRFLHGGRTLVLVAVASTVLAYLVGVPLGAWAGYRRKWVDRATVGLSDLIFAFPALIFLLVLLTAASRSLIVAIVGIAVVNAPRVVRIVRSVAIEVCALEYVEAAIARGERTRAIVARDIFPNILTPVLADFGLRLTASIFLFASLSYLGLGQQPPASDWGLMISENQIGLQLQPWVVAVPAIAIGILVVGVNLMTDGIARTAGRSEGVLVV